MRTHAWMLAAILLAVALVGGCASDQDSGSKPPAHASTKPNGATAVQAKKVSRKYRAIEHAYVRASGDLTRIVSGHRSVSTATLRAAVRKAAAGFDARLRALRRTEWPASARRFVRRYLAIASTKGRALFAKARRARTLADLQHNADVETASRISRADLQMRAHLVRQ